MKYVLNDLRFLDRNVQVGDLWKDDSGCVYLVHCFGVLNETQEEAVILMKFMDTNGYARCECESFHIMALESFLQATDWEKHPDSTQPYRFMKVQGE